MTKQRGFALLLIGCGILMVLGKTGFGLGILMSWLFPFILMGLGYIGWMNERRFIGGVLFVIGALCVLGKLSGLIPWILAAGFVIGGIILLKRKTSYL
ncbi:hypothetical protein WBG83_05420 [Paenibacillus sp. y28]